MKQKTTRNTLFFAILGIAVTLVLAGTATYAWFSSNKAVGTNTAYGKSGTASLRFLMGPDEGNMSEPTESGIEIGQVNTVAKTSMYPVTTADLEKFLYCPGMNAGKATKFVPDDNETRFYHGRLYIRLEGENIAEGAQYKLYLDTAENAGGPFGENASGGHLLNGARLGLKIDGAEKPIIFRFNEENKGKHEINTYVDGKPIASGQVLDANGRPVSDPSEEFTKYSLDSSQGTIEIPEQALATLTINNTVQVDVYFYLEGCDEDCVSEISKQECDIHLAFYAIAASE